MPRPASPASVPSAAVTCRGRSPPPSPSAASATSAPWASRNRIAYRTTCSTIRSSCKEPARRSEEHTSELQSRLHLVCRLLLEKKKKNHRETKSKLYKDIYHDTMV